MSLYEPQHVRKQYNLLPCQPSEGSRLTGFKFIDLAEIEQIEEDKTPIFEKLGDDSFKVSFAKRDYRLEHLKKKGAKLEGLLRLVIAERSYTNPVDFNKFSNRTKRVKEICSVFACSPDDIREDIEQLAVYAEDLFPEELLDNSISKNANEVLSLIKGQDKEYLETPEIVERLCWNKMKASRALKELVNEKRLLVDDSKQPFKYRLNVTVLQNSVDLQGFNT